MFLEDLPRLTVLNPHLLMLVGDPQQPQGTPRTSAVDLPTLAAYLAAVGPAGPAGQSAFQLAQAAGSTLTLPEWLASLQGSPGQRGIQGQAGQQGIQGIQGIQGPAGDPGRRTARVPVGTGLLGVNLSQTVRVTWPTPFADSNYSPFGQLSHPTLGLNPLRVIPRSWDSTGVVFEIGNVGPVGLSMAGVVLIAVGLHD